MKRILTIIGARPQFVKAGVVSSELRKIDNVEEIVVHTGQHFDANMSELFFEELGLGKPDINLGISGGLHGEMTGKMLISIEQVLLEYKPDIILVYGDTNSTLAGALASAKLHIPVAHVEAGLRSFNSRMPEEINRIMTDHVSGWLFAPTDIAVNNLKNEGVSDSKIINVGDVMYDASLLYAKKASEVSGGVDEVVDRNEDYILLTAHRAENTDDLKRLKVIVDSINRVSNDIRVVFPMHPRTKKVLNDNNLLDSLSSKIQILEPQGYIDMIKLEVKAKAIVTDSGGVQKEAFFYNVPCVTLRDETEWLETVDLKWNRISPPISVEETTANIFEALDSEGESGAPYGNGDASAKIAEILSV